MFLTPAPGPRLYLRDHSEGRLVRVALQAAGPTRDEANADRVATVRGGFYFVPLTDDPPPFHPTGRRVGTRARRGTGRGGLRASRNGGRWAGKSGSAERVRCSMADRAAALRRRTAPLPGARHSEAPRRSSPRLAPAPPDPGAGPAPRAARAVSPPDPPAARAPP